MSPSVQRFVGALLMAIGELVAGLCGACTILFQGVSIYDALTRKSALLVLPLEIGAIPIWIGIALFIWGRQIRRQATTP